MSFSAPRIMLCLIQWLYDNDGRDMATDEANQLQSLLDLTQIFSVEEH